MEPALGVSQQSWGWEGRTETLSWLVTQPRDGGLQCPPVLEHFPSSAQPGQPEEVGSTGEEEHAASDSPVLDSRPQSSHC